jgi:ribonuclease P protein component
MQEEEKAVSASVHNIGSLKKNLEVSRVIKEGRKFSCAYFNIFFATSTSGTRITSVASKRLGNSVLRNKIRRRAREALRLSVVDIPRGFDYVFICKKRVLNIEFSALLKQLKMVLGNVK